MAYMTREQAVHLDLILQTLVDKKIKAGSVELVNQNLLPDKSYEYCLSLFYILADHYPKVIWPKSDVYPESFWASEYTTAFLHDGGYTELYDREDAKQQKEASRQSLQDQKLEADLRSSKFQSTVGIAIAIIGTIVSLSTSFNSCKKSASEIEALRQKANADSIAMSIRLSKIEASLTSKSRDSIQSNQ